MGLPAALPLSPRGREVRESAAYDRAMGLFRSVTDLFRSRAGKSREKAAAELPDEQTQAAAELPEEQTQAAAELPEEQTQAAAQVPEEQTQAAAQVPEEQTQAAAELPDEETQAVKAQPEVAPREVKYEARPDPDKPGWGLAFGQEIRKAREGRGGQE
jgi:hypothetical protein